MKKKLIMKLLFFLKPSRNIILTGVLIFLLNPFLQIEICKAQQKTETQKQELLKLVILGDSLTEGFGVSRESAFPALLEKKIQAAGKKWSVVNAGVSGSTSASAVSRLKWLAKNKPDFLMIALGANDGLRGMDVRETKKNLEQTIELALNEKIKIILVGMMMPPNYGKQYTEGYKKTFTDLSKKYKVHFVPFLLQDVAGHKELNQSDGIHPNEKGHEIIAENIFKSIKGWL